MYWSIPSSVPILASCCSTHQWLRGLWRKRLRPRRALCQLSWLLRAIKKHYGLAWRKSQRLDQVQIDARRKGSFVPLSSLSSPDVEQLGRARGWDLLCFSLIALHYTRRGLGESAVSWAVSARGQREVQTPACLSKLVSVAL